VTNSGGDALDEEIVVRLGKLDSGTPQRTARTKARRDERIGRVVEIGIVVDVRKDAWDAEIRSAARGAFAKCPNDVAEHFPEFLDVSVQRIHISILRSSCEGHKRDPECEEMSGLARG
jgi:hypothetical protein